MRNSPRKKTVPFIKPTGNRLCICSRHLDGFISQCKLESPDSCSNASNGRDRSMYGRNASPKHGKHGNYLAVAVQWRLFNAANPRHVITDDNENAELIFAINLGLSGAKNFDSRFSCFPCFSDSKKELFPRNTGGMMELSGKPYENRGLTIHNQKEMKDEA